MAGSSTSIGNNSRGSFHNRLPVRVGHVGNEDVAVPDAVHFLCVRDNFDRSASNPLADAAALDENSRPVFKGVALNNTIAFALDRLRTCLQEVDLAILAVLAPFDIHWTPIMIFYNKGVAGQGFSLLIRQRKLHRLARIDVDDRHILSGIRIVVIDHFYALIAEIFSQDRASARL